MTTKTFYVAEALFVTEFDVAVDVERIADCFDYAENLERLKGSSDYPKIFKLTVAIEEVKDGET